MKTTKKKRAGILAGLLLFAGHALSQERTGEEVVKQQCGKCHESGLHGAPRIDQRSDWIPRMKKGVEATVRSAIRGHGRMPARGGVADLTDTELRSAILYMFYPAGSVRGTPPPPPVARDPSVKVVGGMDVHLGVMLADSIRTRDAKPSGSDQYHINITLRDSATKAPIQDAKVQARVGNPVTGTQTRGLEPMASDGGGTGSYGGYFRMTSREPYTLRVRVRRPQSSGTVEARFDFRR